MQNVAQNPPRVVQRVGINTSAFVDKQHVGLAGFLSGTTACTAQIDPMQMPVTGKRQHEVVQGPRSLRGGLSDNGSAYIAEQTRLFAREIGLQPVTTPVRSPQSNGMAESFVKTIKRDYVAYMPKPDRETALRNLAIAFEHYNEEHPHSALKYRSPREFRRLAATSI